jgi:hypothetical protein
MGSLNGDILVVRPELPGIIICPKELNCMRFASVIRKRRSLLSADQFFLLYCGVELRHLGTSRPAQRTKTSFTSLCS